MKLGIITSNQLRHEYFAASIINEYKTEFLISEPKAFKPENSYINEKEKIALKKHFFERGQSEKRYFGRPEFYEKFKKVDQTVTERVNSDFIISLVKSSGVKIICVFGSSILQPAFTKIKDISIINMHLGLSPYYRGSGTNLFPIMNDELSCVGATIHKLTDIIDGGSIYRQIRPEMEINDSIHDIGNKTIKAGTQAMVLTVQDIILGKAKPKYVDKANGRLYRRKDFNYKVLSESQKNISSGAVGRYLNDKSKYDSKYPIIN